MDWNTVKAEHVAKACELAASGSLSPHADAKSIFLVFEGKRLPAKQVVRVAYRIANNLPMDSLVDFDSGEKMIRRLRRLGFEVERVNIEIAKS